MRCIYMSFRNEILNVKNSTRNLTDEDFNNNLNYYSEELSKIDYHYNYSNEELLKS